MMRAPPVSRREGWWQQSYGQTEPIGTPEQKPVPLDNRAGDREIVSEFESRNPTPRIVRIAIGGIPSIRPAPRGGGLWRCSAFILESESALIRERLKRVLHPLR